jgi:signal transduction histidine kinase
MSQHSRSPAWRAIYPSINTRVTGPFVIVVGLVAVIGVFIVTRLVAGSLQERFNNQLLDSARAATNTIADIEREQLATLRLMVFTEGVAEALSARDTAKLDELLRPVLTNAGADEMIVFDTAGQGQLHLARGSGISLDYSVLAPPDMRGWEGAKQVLDAQSDTLGDKHVDIVESLAGPLFFITAPVKDADGKVIGGVSLGMRLQRLTLLVSEQSLSSVALYDAQGHVLGSTFRTIPDEKLVLSPSRVKEFAHYTVESSPIIDLEFEGAPYQVLYTSFQIRSQPVGLVAVGLPTNYIVERIGTSRNWFGALFAGLFLFVVLLGSVAARTIIHPVRRLVDTTRAIRDGDLSRRVKLNTPDELGELATSFDHMTEQLVQQNMEIETLYRKQLHETAVREAVLTNIGDAVLVQDNVGKLVLRNETAKNLLSVVNLDPYERRIFEDICRRPETCSQPRMMKLAGGHFSVLAKAVSLPSGDLVGHVIVFRDLTALVESERLKDELILQMSHELRTPLTAARGFVDLVNVFEQNNLSVQGQEFFANTMTNLAELERMINQVIDVSAIIAQRFSVGLQPVNIAELLQECADHWHDLASKRELQIALSLPRDDLWVNGDKRYLSQVFDHLIRNSCSYTLPGGSVQLAATPQNNRVVIYVIDDGVGIAPEERERVFDRMYRGKSAQAGPTDTRGLGLGLYLSKHIIEAHHGTIQLESKLDYGTVIMIDLPKLTGGSHEHDAAYRDHAVAEAAR